MLETKTPRQFATPPWHGVFPEQLAIAVEEIARFCILPNSYVTAPPPHLIRWALEPLDSIYGKALQAQIAALKEQVTEAWNKGDMDAHSRLIAMTKPLYAASEVLTDASHERLAFVIGDWRKQNPSIYGPC